MLDKALARWTEQGKIRSLQRQLGTLGLDVFAHQPEHHYVHKYFGRSARKLVSGLDDPEFLPLAEVVWSQGRTFLYYNRLHTLYRAVRTVVRQYPDGPLGFLEVGVHRGGSSYFLAELAQRHARGRVTLTSVDTFAGHAVEDLPAGSEGAHGPGDFQGPVVEDVRDYLSPFGFVEVKEGRIQDVGRGLAGDLHLVHCDVDIHAPTEYTLAHARERLVPGGVIVVDDYGFTTCPGARLATDEFVAGHGDGFAMFPLDTGQALLVRVR